MSYAYTVQCLNLVAVKGLQDMLIRNMVVVVDRAATYIGGHHKPQQALEKAINGTQPQSTRNMLYDMCRTRRVQRLVITNKYIGYLRALTCSLQAEAKIVV